MLNSLVLNETEEEVEEADKEEAEDDVEEVEVVDNGPVVAT